MTHTRAQPREPMDDPGAPLPFGRRDVTAIAFLVLLTAGLYAVSLRTEEFLFDDITLIKENTGIQSLGNAGRFFLPPYWQDQRTERSYRPVVEVTLAVNWSVAGGRPAGLRAVNIGLLAAIAALIYWLVRRLARARSAALVAGLVFAVHPMHVETVTIIKNRGELLAGLFGLLALLAFLRSASGGRRRWVWWLGTVLATAAALGSKEVALALPLVLTAAAVTLVPRGRRRRALGLTLPTWLLAAGLLALAFIALTRRYRAPAPIDDLRSLEFAALGLGERVLVIIKTVGTYLGMLVGPFAPCGDRAFAVPHSPWRADVLLSLIAMLAVAALVVWAWRRHRAEAFALLWIGLAIGPVANLSPVATRPIAEQRLFAATIPFAILVGLVLARLGALPFLDRKPPHREARRKPLGGEAVFVNIILVAWLAVTGVITAVALPHWRTELDFWNRTVRQSPDVYRVQYNCGTTLVKHQRYKEAMGHLQRAVRLDDLQSDALHNLAASLIGLGRSRDAKPLLRLVIARRPDHAESHSTMAAALLKEGQSALALVEAHRAVGLDPANAVHHGLLARALAQAGRHRDALEPLRQARDLAPDVPRRWLNLAAGLERAGRLEEAFKAYQDVADRWAGRDAARKAKAAIDRLQKRRPPSE